MACFSRVYTSTNFLLEQVQEWSITHQPSIIITYFWVRTTRPYVNDIVLQNKVVKSGTPHKLKLNPFHLPESGKIALLHF
jgi:hypothetical protein